MESNRDLIWTNKGGDPSLTITHGLGLDWIGCIEEEDGAQQQR